MDNKKRLIDADALDTVPWEDKWDAIKAIKNAPTVDAVEVVHGRWINIWDYGDGNCFGFCSHCVAEQKAQNATALKAFHKYCRWCGAKMDAEGEDNGQLHT